MRILIYWEQESWGGVDNHLYELLSSWPSKKDKFVLMVNRGNAGFARLKTQFTSLGNVEYIEVSSYSYNEVNRRLRQQSFLRPLRWMLYFFQPIIFYLTIINLHRHFSQAGSFDLLLADNGAYPAAWGTICALGAAKRANIQSRLMLIHHSSNSPGLMMGLFERYVDRFVTNNATALVCVSNATRNSLLEKRTIDDTQVRLRTIYNGLANGLYKPSDDVIKLRENVSAGDNEYLVGIVARLSQYKGQEDLVLALARLDAKHQSRIQIVFIGSGDPPSEVDHLKSLAANLNIAHRVHFLGYLPGDSRDFISQMDLLLMTTRSFEGFGLTLIEAMSVGTPILATNVGAIPEFVTPEIGKVIPPNSPMHISQQLIDFIENTEIWHQRSSKAKDMLQSRKYNMAKEYEVLFRECVALNKDPLSQ